MFDFGKINIKVRKILNLIFIFKYFNKFLILKKKTLFYSMNMNAAFLAKFICAIKTDNRSHLNFISFIVYHLFILKMILNKLFDFKFFWMASQIFITGYPKSIIIMSKNIHLKCLIKLIWQNLIWRYLTITKFSRASLKFIIFFLF